MAIGRISGPMLYSNLERQGVDLAVETDLIYFDVTNSRVGVHNTVPNYSFDSTGNVRLANLVITHNAITSNTGKIDFGTISNVRIAGGANTQVIATDGFGNLQFVDVAYLTPGLYGNAIVLGANTAPSLVSNAVTLTTTTTVTDAVAKLNNVLGKLVPPSPAPFPGAQTLTLSTAVTAGKMTNFTQTDNSGWGNLGVAAGTTISATRVATYTTNTIANVGPGDTGTVTSYFNGIAAGSATLTGSSNGTYGNLIISLNQDFHNVWANVAAQFWYSFSASTTGNTVPAGWNRASIYHTGAGARTNTITWYYDNSAPGTPTYSNTSITLSANSVTYSSTIPHYNSSAQYRIKGNVAKLSGDTYPSTVTAGTSNMVTGTAGGPFQAPVAVTYTAAGVTVPLERNLYVSSGSAYFETTSNIVTGFGSSTTGPTLTVNNNYASGVSSALVISGTPTILYKTGTTSLMEESTVTFGSTVGTGAGLASRIINPGSTDTPAYTAGASLFDSQNSTLQTYDATIVAAILKHDQTNYSTGYLPAGPNLSTGRSGSQYFTFRFVRTSLSKFDIKFSGTIAGLWVAVPGSTIDAASSLSGWVDMSVAYAGAGVPGANVGSGGNGSNGCALGGVVSLNTLVSAHRKTCTFGTVSTSSTATNEVYVRIKLTAGQTVTALSLETATN